MQRLFRLMRIINNRKKIFDIFTIICEKPTPLGVGWIARNVLVKMSKESV